MKKIFRYIKNNKVKILAISTVLLTIIYILGNFDSILLYNDRQLMKKGIFNSPWLKYQYWLEDVFGQEKGLHIWHEFKRTSLHFADMNKILLVIITIMMLGTLISGTIKKKKFNWILAIYFVLCFIAMYFIAFYASPVYVDYWPI